MIDRSNLDALNVALTTGLPGKEPQGEPVIPQNQILPINKDPYANPIDTIRRMRRYDPAFTKAFDRGQRTFTLVEQDATAYKAIAQWINCNMERLGKNHPKIIGAKHAMVIFMDGHKGLHKKLPD